MKLKHNAPTLRPQSAVITPEYQTVVDRSTDKAAAAHQRAQRRLAAAQQRLERAETGRAKAVNAQRRRDAERELKVAAELVELRRDELKRIETLMKAAPASAEHRGVHGFRPVPQPGGAF